MSRPAWAGLTPRQRWLWARAKVHYALVDAAEALRLASEDPMWRLIRTAGTIARWTTVGAAAAMCLSLLAADISLWAGILYCPTYEMPVT